MSVSGTTKLERLHENLRAVDIQLTAAERQRIEEGTAKIQIQGARFPAQLQSQFGRESPSKPS